MNQHANGSAASAGTDPDLIQLIDELADRYQTGEPVDWDAVAREHPGKVDRARALWPAIAAMAELGSVTGRHSLRGALPRADPAPILHELGDFRILREIGRGGMGVVYEAIQVSLGRQVALKVLPFAPVLSEKPLQRFKNEAQAAAHLNHPNIVPVYAVGCERGVHYYAMRYIEGRTLAAVITELLRLDAPVERPAHPEPTDELAFTTAVEIASGQFIPDRHPCTEDAATASYLPPAVEPGEGTPDTPTRGAGSSERSNRTAAFFRTSARLGLQAAEALDHAHEQGILHRDIKPSNLLIDAQGNLWIADFGLARVQGDAGLTMTGDLLGTLRYMSPEQALAKRVVVDHRTDIYSLGVTLYELLTLGPAYSGRDREEILRRIAFEEPPAPRKHNPSIPVALETIVLKAMAKDPSGRYASARDLADDLRRFLNHEPIRARRSGPTERLMMWARRRPAIAGLVCLVALVSTTGFVTSTAQWIQTDRARRAVTAVNEMLEKALYYNRIALADRELAVNNLRRVDQLLAECPAGLRGWEWYYLKRARSGYLPVVCRAGTQVFDVAFSHDGRRLVTGQLDGTAVIWDAATGKALHVLPGRKRGDVQGVAFSPDGWQVASNNRGEVMIWDAMTGKLIDSLRTIGGGLGMEFSPDGRLIASTCDGQGRDEKAIMIWDAATHRLIRTIPHSSGFVDATFSPDGTRLAVTEGDDDNVTILEVSTGKALQVLPGHTGGSRHAAYSPDGRYLAVACGSDVTENHGSVKIWDAATGRPLHTLGGHTKTVWGVTFSPDGRRLASASWDHKVKLWDPATGQEVLTLHGHGIEVANVAFSPDGRRLATASTDGTLRIWDASPISEPPPRELLNLTEHIDEVCAVAYSPDGRWLASAGDDLIVRLWDTTNGRIVRLFRGHTHPVRGLAFSPDGRRLASADPDETIRVWEVETGSVVLALHGNDAGKIMGIAYSPDGLNFATVSGVYGDVWDAATGKHLRNLPEHDWGVYCLAYSGDGRWIATGSRDGAVKVAEASTGRLVKTLNENTGRTHAVAFSPDGEYLAAAGANGTVKVWDTKGWTGPYTILAHADAALGVAFSPDGRRLASGGADQTIKVWDRTAGRELLSLRGHLGEVNAVAFSPDGKRLASAGGDHTVKVWDVMPGPDAGP
jgi:eukaryotic-like serine/threonine-protein kinase